uniref:Uncharacterized protein n=1 Tax=Cacopsylla melanoneura TaxID=428564 RepID=A0A8D8WTC0_9HEMI
MIVRVHLIGTLTFHPEIEQFLETGPDPVHLPIEDILIVRPKPTGPLTEDLVLTKKSMMTIVMLMMTLVLMLKIVHKSHDLPPRTVDHIVKTPTPVDHLHPHPILPTSTHSSSNSLPTT